MSCCGPMISDMLETAHLFEKEPNKVYDHHEDYVKTNSLMIKRFQGNVRKFRKSIFRARTAASSYHTKEIT